MGAFKRPLVLVVDLFPKSLISVEAAPLLFGASTLAVSFGDPAG
jgi:hypothetical protein